RTSGSVPATACSSAYPVPGATRPRHHLPSRRVSARRWWTARRTRPPRGSCPCAPVSNVDRASGPGSERPEPGRKTVSVDVHTGAHQFNWMLANFVRNTDGVRDAVAVSSDGLLIATSDGLD